jgi:glutaredoxin
MSDNNRPPASAPSAPPPDGAELVTVYNYVQKTELPAPSDPIAALSEEETEACRKLNDYIIRNNIKKKKIPLECCCGFLTVVIVVLIIMITIRGNVLRSRLSTKKQLLYFSRPGCPHCERFDSTWNNAVEKIKKDASINVSTKKINCKDPANAAMCAKESKDHGMKGVPHVVRINTNGSRTIFTNERTVENLLAFANN